MMKMAEEDTKAAVWQKLLPAERGVRINIVSSHPPSADQKQVKFNCHSTFLSYSHSEVQFLSQYQVRLGSILGWIGLDWVRFRVGYLVRLSLNFAQFCVQRPQLPFPVRFLVLALHFSRLIFHFQSQFYLFFRFILVSISVSYSIPISVWFIRVPVQFKAPFLVLFIKLTFFSFMLPPFSLDFHLDFRVNFQIEFPPLSHRLDEFQVKKSLKIE